MITQDQEPEFHVLSVRIPDKIYEAYTGINKFYGVKQSDLIRMAPLLLILLAEGSLANRWKNVQKKEEALRQSQNFDWKAFREVDQERDAVKNREIFGERFIQYLRELAKEALNDGTIRPEDIEEGKGGLPEYLILHTLLLRKAANEIAKIAKEQEKQGITHLLDEDAYNKYDRQLLAVSRKKLDGNDLSENQKNEVRKYFREALQLEHSILRLEHSMLLRKAANEIAEIAEKQEKHGITHLLDADADNTYDRQLLAVSRKKLGGNDLNEDQKGEVRKYFKEALRLTEATSQSPNKVTSPHTAPQDVDTVLRETAFHVVKHNVLGSDDINSLLEKTEIPYRYDAQLLAISRKKLKKPLNLGEKSMVRKQFHHVLEEFQKIQNKYERY